MIRYLFHRSIGLFFALFGISVIIFVLIRMVPGDTVQAIFGQVQQSEETYAAVREFLGLDQPIHIQYFRWFGNMLEGDLGVSWRNRMPIIELIKDRTGVTLELTMLAMFITVGLGIPFGVLSAIKRATWIDDVVRFVSLVSLSIPEFFQGVLLILFFSLVLKWIPSVRYVSFTEDPIKNLSILIIPALSVGTVRAAGLVRMTRACMLDVLSSEYVKVARAKGLPERIVLYTHALRSALIPIVTQIGLMVGYLLSGAVIVEMVFSLPGLGRLLVMGISQRDYPVVQVVALILSFLFLLSNLFVDLLYSYIDPRIRRA